MSSSTLTSKIELAAEYLHNVLKLRAPKDTWNLTFNGIRLVYIDSAHIKIIIGGEPAPYAIYTNEPWSSPRWNGKSNPNEGWINNAVHGALPTIKAILGGRNDLTLAEIEKLNAEISNSFAQLERSRESEK